MGGDASAREGMVQDAVARGVGTTVALTAPMDAPGRFDGLRVVGVNERDWRHTRRGEKPATDLRPDPPDSG